MPNFKAPIWAAALLLTTAPALGQEMYPGQSVTVNPGAVGGRLLLYPGGQYLRLQRPLLQPGQKNPNAPIRLRPPGSRPVRTASKEPSAPPPERTAKLEPPSPIPAAPPKAPVPERTARPAAEKPAPKPTQTAKAEPAPARTQPEPAAAAGADDMAGWNKSGLIEFLPDQGEVQPARLDAVKFLAGALNTSMSVSPAARVEILAYGGARGDKGSDARRLSLRRALSVRQILIDSGVSKDRIGVRAMGGADDGGPADRVDVYVHS